MKIKGLLISMLACTAMLVGCSDDDVLNNSELENQQVEKMRAYMTFSIASATNSSRGVGEGATDGDKHGNPEHSGHETEGTTKENNVNSILICFYNTKEGTTDGFSHKFDMKANSAESVTYNGYSTQLTQEEDGSYSLQNPFAINTTGKYNVMVVINPSSNITTTNATDKSGALAIYNKLKDEFANSVEAIIGEDKDNFMMANRKLATIDVTAANNDPKTPATTEGGEPIEVERVVSKITFRSNDAPQGAPTSLGDKNVYEINQTEYSYSIVQENFWFKASDGIYQYLTNLFKAETPGGVEYWVHITKDESNNITGQAFYQVNSDFKDSADDIKGGSAADGMYEGNLQNGTAPKARVVVAANKPDTYVYVGTKSETGSTSTYYVRLEGYTLVNLNNTVFYVRHTSSDMTTYQPWGFVNSKKNYIYEPNSKEKSALSFASAPLAWPDNADKDAGDYYTNDFVTVTDNIAKGTHKMSLFGTEGSTNVDAEVSPSETGVDKGITPDATTTGILLDYCLENAVLAEKQNALTSTSIIFEAQIYESDGTRVGYMIEHGGNFYKSFLALQEATATVEGDITTSPFWRWADEDYPETKEERLEWAKAIYDEGGAVLYHDGKCYYFSSQIEHFDNDGGFDANGKIIENGPGVMENAIMRNNVYSLSVESVNKFGFSSINLGSGVLNGEESGTEQEKIYLTMKAKILPWIVRFNNIKF